MRVELASGQGPTILMRYRTSLEGSVNNNLLKQHCSTCSCPYGTCPLDINRHLREAATPYIVVMGGLNLVSLQSCMFVKRIAHPVIKIC